MLRPKMAALFASLFLVITAEATAAPTDPTGDWVGKLETPQGNLGLVLTINRKADGSLRAELESPDQAPGQKIPVGDITIEDDTLRFEAPVIGASYKGKWRGDHWDGTFRQGDSLDLDLRRGSIEKKPTISGLDGRWNATIQGDDGPITLLLTILTGSNGTAATFSLPRFELDGAPITGLARTASRVTFEMPAIEARFSGIIGGNGKRLEGTITAPGEPVSEVTFYYTGRADARAQDPAEPYPYRAEDVSFANPTADDVTLAGTLTLPKGAGPFPAAILISGSGPQDRNEELMNHRPFLVLADYLTRRGIAVLRYDDRGYGDSSGDFAAATSADFATDANAAFHYLRSRPEIDPAAIGMIGHSEGGMIAPIAAADNPDVAYIVFLAGPGTAMMDEYLAQIQRVTAAEGAPKTAIDAYLETAELLFNEILKTSSQAEAENVINRLLTDDRLRAMGMQPEQRPMLTQTFATDWFRYFLAYDSKEWLEPLQMPVLGLFGELDIQVSAAANSRGMRAAWHSHPDATVKVMKDLNHLFQTAETGQLEEYSQIEETFAPKALKTIGDWITQRF